MKALIHAAREQRGQIYIEFVLVLPVLLLALGALIFFGRVLYVKIALDMASYDACRAAVEAMQAPDGIRQGTIAGQNTLRGFYLNSAAAHVTVSPQGMWQRGTRVLCETVFDLNVADVPLVGLFAGKAVSLQSTNWSRIETWRSYWQ